MSAPHFLRRRREARRRKARAESAALAGPALDRERGLMARERMLDDGQAEARAAGLARAAAVDAIEPLGQPRQVLRVDADAGVLDRELAAGRTRAPAQAHLA